MKRKGVPSQDVGFDRKRPAISKEVARNEIANLYSTFVCLGRNDAASEKAFESLLDPVSGFLAEVDVFWPGPLIRCCTLDKFVLLHR
jgi:hypothetical protein